VDDCLKSIIWPAKVVDGEHSLVGYCSIVYLMGLDQENASLAGQWLRGRRLAERTLAQRRAVRAGRFQTSIF